MACGPGRCSSWALGRRLDSCGPWALLLRGIWDPPGSGIEPGSPALAGGLFIMAPPGKPRLGFYTPGSTDPDYELIIAVTD